jgi:hypothetical protein
MPIKDENQTTSNEGYGISTEPFGFNLIVIFVRKKDETALLIVHDGHHSLVH